MVAPSVVWFGATTVELDDTSPRPPPISTSISLG
jgi:hypothetical protein